MNKILIVEDEIAIEELIKISLEARRIYMSIG